MARARSIKPSFFNNEYLAGMSPHARLLFIGLWCLADREGRLEDRPKRIKASIFPYEENINVDQLLADLANSQERFIIRYSPDEGSHYIQITNFNRHQSPHVKESASTIPAPDLTVDRPLADANKSANTNNHNRSTRQAPDKHQTSTSVAHRTPHSPFPIPHSGQLTTDSGDPASAGKSVSVIQEDIDEIKNLCFENLSDGVDYDEATISIAINRYTKQWVIEAIKEAVKTNNPTWGYVLGILYNCENEGHAPGESRSAPVDSCAGCNHRRPLNSKSTERCAVGHHPPKKCGDFTPSRVKGDKRQ